jgi:hypothetical protein
MSAYPAGAGSVTHVPGPTIDTLELNRRREECGIAISLDAGAAYEMVDFFHLEKRRK